MTGLSPLFALGLACGGEPVLCPDTRGPSRLDPLPEGCDRVVAPTGDDGDDGRPDGPWRTVGKAASSALPGEVVCVRAGTYREAVVLRVSGDPGAPIVLRAYPGERPVLDGEGLPGDTALLHIEDQAHLVLAGFELRGLRTRARNAVPMGILVTGAAHDITLRDNHIHDLGTDRRVGWGTDAHGIAVYGTKEQPIHDLVIDNNELNDLRLGSSEALVVNGNVENWQITNNFIHDCDNIAIDAIGFEGTAPADDQARDGRIADNRVCDIDSRGNPAYGRDRAAGGIYVDGGTRIVIERNEVHHANLGIELASEHAGRATSEITARDNVLWANTGPGIAVGGYDEARGSTEDCTIVHNTTFQNDTDGAGYGELLLQVEVRGLRVEHNVFVAGEAGLFLGSWSTALQDNIVDDNLYFSAAGGGAWEWKGERYDTAERYRQGSGNDGASLFGVDPRFVDPDAGDLHLGAGSPAVDRAAPDPDAGEEDIDREPRVQGPAADWGADESG